MFFFLKNHKRSIVSIANILSQQKLIKQTCHLTGRFNSKSEPVNVYYIMLLFNHVTYIMCATKLKRDYCRSRLFSKNYIFMGCIE